MRWGVTEEAGDDHSTVAMCVKEIQKYAEYTLSLSAENTAKRLKYFYAKNYFCFQRHLIT